MNDNLYSALCTKALQGLSVEIQFGIAQFCRVIAFMVLKVDNANFFSLVDVVYKLKYW